MAGAFPIGIDYKFFSRRPVLAPDFYEQPGSKPEAIKTILSLSRLDYTKGIPEQLEAIAELATRPEWHGKFVYRLVVVPSRDTQPEYAALKRSIEKQVKAINQAAGPDWQPVVYEYGSIDAEVLKATYRKAQIMLVTPHADGMNLVAKEYLAANPRGNLILSRGAGAAEQLHEAVLVDPGRSDDILAAVEQLLRQPASPQTVRRLRKNIQQEDVFQWAEHFLSTLMQKKATKV